MLTTTDLPDGLSPASTVVLTEISDPYYQLLQKVSALRQTLAYVPIYDTVNDLASLRHFMESHVFALWSSMTLLNALQRCLTSKQISCLTAIDSDSAQLIHETAQAEEFDHTASVNYPGQFSLYLTAMTEVGANLEPIQLFIEALNAGMRPKQAINGIAIPGKTKTAVAIVLAISSLTPHEVAAAFLLGREDPALALFAQHLTQLEHMHRIHYPTLRLYLQRHAYLNAEIHNPLGEQLLRNLCGHNALKWEQAQETVELALSVQRLIYSQTENTSTSLEIP
jgi:hypothetical protein